MKIPIYIVSLKQEIKRRKHIESQFTDLNIPFKFFDAVDKNSLPQVLNKHLLSFNNHSLTTGEKGCFYSHYLLWQKMLNENLPYMVIGEDDMVISNKLNQMLFNLDDIMDKCDILKFETMELVTLITEEKITILESSGLKIQRLNYAHLGTAGYVITNKMAKQLCDFFHNMVINKPIDQYLFVDFVYSHKVFQTIPALAIQEDVLYKNDESVLHSQIQQERKMKTSSTIEKILRETKRLIEQASLTYWKQQLKLKKQGVFIKFDGGR